MNERIQKLIEQCTSWSEGSTWTSHEEFDKEKFAELIVRECADIALTEAQSTGNFDTFNKIVKHFGVE
jgi:hypothetical protein